MLKHCLFCKIIKGEVPADIISRNKRSIAFKDINPQAKVHILIVPNIHIQSTRELHLGNIEYLSEMALLANKIAKLKNVSSNGYRWIINTGSDGGQTVNHLHLHLIGGRQLGWPPG